MYTFSKNAAQRVMRAVLTVERLHGKAAQAKGPRSSLQGVPSGTVVMVHLFTGESITDFFDTGTGLGTGRWAGWALCDGQNDGPDMLGFFPVCADVDNDDYDLQGHGLNTNAQTGFKYHSLKHEHALSFDPQPHEVGATGTGVWAWDSTDNSGGISIQDDEACINWNGYESGELYVRPDTVTDLSGAGSGTDFIVDNRPPNYVIHFAVKL